MSLPERRQYLDARLWFSRELEVCFVCESSMDLRPYEGGWCCGSCLDELTGLALDASPEDLGAGSLDPGDLPLEG